MQRGTEEVVLRLLQAWNSRHVHFTVQFKGRLHLQHADWVLMMVHTSLLLGSMALGAWVALLQLDGA